LRRPSSTLSFDNNYTAGCKRDSQAGRR